MQVGTVCPEDQLDRSWQRLILTHLLEREHPGVLTGSALTDVRITLLAAGPTSSTLREATSARPLTGQCGRG